MKFQILLRTSQWKQEARAIHVIKKQHHQHHPLERKCCSISPNGVAVFSSNTHQQWDLGSLSQCFRCSTRKIRSGHH